LPNHPNQHQTHPFLNKALGPVALTLECEVHRTTALAPTGYGHSDTSRFIVASCELAAGVAAGAAMAPRAIAFPGLVVRAGLFYLCVCMEWCCVRP
jgi:hypothetical protein